jgi:hypothetical protein
MELKFVNRLEVNKNTLEDLDSFRQLEELYAVMEDEGFLEDDYEGMFEFWQVEDAGNPGQPVYDVWLLHVDTGTVFRADTLEDTGVGMIQNYFDNISAGENGDALAKALQKAFYNKSRT